MKKLLLCVALSLISFCSRTAVAATITYQFQPDPNALRTSGGISGGGKGSYSIEGQFELSVNLNTAVASFRWVDAALSEKIWFVDYNEGGIVTDDLDTLFHMTELVSTDVNETAIYFELRRNDPIFPGADILVVVTCINNSVHLAGNFCEAVYDGFCYHLDAVALPLPKTYHDLAEFADQWLLEKLFYDIAPHRGDGIVNFLDWAAFANNWQGDMVQLSVFSSQWLKSSAYNADIAPEPGGDGIVNFLDFAVFAENWLEGGNEGGYVQWLNVQPCDTNGGQLNMDSNDTRFSITVQGNNLYFEDLINANCCKDEIRLDVSAEDNRITIYETEITPNPCRCLCDYPTTALLGPFADGDYTVEVFDVGGGSLGAVEITIPSQ